MGIRVIKVFTVYKKGLLFGIISNKNMCCQYLLESVLLSGIQTVSEYLTVPSKSAIKSP